MVSPAVQSLPLTVNPAPGSPNVGDTDMLGITVKSLPEAVVPSVVSLAVSGSLPGAMPVGTWQPLVLWSPVMLPSPAAESVHTWTPSMSTSMSSPEVQPLPLTVNAVPGSPDVGETVTLCANATGAGSTTNNPVSSPARREERGRMCASRRSATAIGRINKLPLPLSRLLIAAPLDSRPCGLDAVQGRDIGVQLSTAWRRADEVVRREGCWAQGVHTGDRQRIGGRQMRRLVPTIAGAGIAALMFAGATIASGSSFTLRVRKDVHVTNAPNAMFAAKPVNTHEAVAVGAAGYAVYTFQGETSHHFICRKTSNPKTNCWAFWPPVSVASSKGLSKQAGI